MVSVIQGSGGPSDVSINNYNVLIYANGKLREDFTYTFTNSNYHMMYRDWYATVSTTPISTPYIQPLSISAPAGTTSYIKDQFGDVSIVGGSNDPSIVNAIRQLAYVNEVGCYIPGHFGPGTQSISYLYKIYPPLETDGAVVHLNLVFRLRHPNLFNAVKPQFSVRVVHASLWQERLPSLQHPADARALRASRPAS